MVDISRFKQEKQPKATICTKCVHFMSLEPGSVRKHVWYNQLCKAAPLPTKIDPYDDNIKPFNINNFGNEYFTENEFRYCRDVNDGNCPKFQTR